MNPRNIYHPAHARRAEEWTRADARRRAKEHESRSEWAHAAQAWRDAQEFALADIAEETAAHAKA